MAKKKINPEEDRFRNFAGVIYSDSTTYDFEEVLIQGQNYFIDFGYILHDRDIDENGNIKKAHIHWLGRRKNAVHLKTVSKALGLKDNEVEIVRNWKGAVRYLTHIDYPDKSQYDITEIQGKILDLPSYFEILSEGESMIKMLKQRDEGMSFRQILFDSVDRGYYAHFRRNIGLLLIIEEDDKRMLAPKDVQVTKLGLTKSEN